MSTFARISSGTELWPADTQVPRHRHEQAYAAIVLSGCYEECGSLGRFRVGPGDVVLHGRFEAHLDRFGAHGAQILNLALPHLEHPLHCGAGHLRSADVIARLAATDVISASLLLHEQLIVVAAPSMDWPDILAADLIENPQLPLGDWACKKGLAAETLSRGFQKMFGITPAAFRAEARARRAFVRIENGTESLAEIAAAAGFADQAHMSRATKTLTGRSPGYWRTRSNRFKTGEGPAY